ncbi:hypothetical protein LTR28_014087 [Elasticomyces elasticus]|nr:hypothetical protein LTR28_014087 [Elasticomyces elasticus]
MAGSTKAQVVDHWTPEDQRKDRDRIAFTCKSRSRQARRPGLPDFTTPRAGRRTDLPQPTPTSPITSTHQTPTQPIALTRPPSRQAHKAREKQERTQTAESATGIGIGHILHGRPTTTTDIVGLSQTHTNLRLDGAHAPCNPAIGLSHLEHRGEVARRNTKEPQETTAAVLHDATTAASAPHRRQTGDPDPSIPPSQ